MPTKKVRKISGQEVTANKQKLEFLRSHGVNVSVDGNWGPWQLQLYERLQNGSRQAGAGAVAGTLTGGYALGLLLNLVGQSVATQMPLADLAPTLATVAPIAFTLAGPAYGAYELATGQAHSIPQTDALRLQNTFAADATRVARPEVVTPITRVQSPRVFALPKADVGSIVMRADTTHTAAPDTTRTVPLDSAGIAARVAAETEARIRAELLAREDSLYKNRNWRQRLGDRISGKKNPSTNTGNLSGGGNAGGTGEQQSSEYNWSWKPLKGYGNGAGWWRVPAAARDMTYTDLLLNGLDYYSNPDEFLYAPIAWKIPKFFGTIAHQLKGNGNLKLAPADSTLTAPPALDIVVVTTLPNDTVLPTSYGAQSPTTKSSLQELDSINNIWWNQQ